MVAAGWVPTVENYLGRVTKARILGAVREAKGEQAAQLIDHFKKADMAEKAEALLAGSGWLPEPLRTPGWATTSLSFVAQQDAISVADSGGVATTAVGCETAMVETEASIQNGQAVIDPHAAVAE